MDFLIKILRENIKFYREQVAQWEKRKKALKALEVPGNGPDLKKAIKDAIDNADQMIDLNKKAIKKNEEQLSKLG